MKVLTYRSPGTPADIFMFMTQDMLLLDIVPILYNSCNLPAPTVWPLRDVAVATLNSQRSDSELTLVVR